jgi:urease accessory protein
MSGKELTAAMLAWALLLAAPAAAMAHSGMGGLGGFTAGVVHPLFGPDHLVAMLAIGLLAGQAGNERGAMAALAAAGRRRGRDAGLAVGLAGEREQLDLGGWA